MKFYVEFLCNYGSRRKKDWTIIEFNFRSEITKKSIIQKIQSTEPWIDNVYVERIIKL